MFEAVFLADGSGAHACFELGRDPILEPAREKGWGSGERGEREKKKQTQLTGLFWGFLGFVVVVVVEWPRTGI